MASTTKLQSTANGDFHRYYTGVEISDFYVNSMNTVRPQEKAQSGNEIKFSVPIGVGTSTSINLPFGNYNFIGNCMLRITGTRGKAHTPKHIQLPGGSANQILHDTGTSGAYKYTSPTGNTLPMNGYDLIDEVQIMLPGDEYYAIKGKDMFTFLMAQCETKEKRDTLWKISRIDPPMGTVLDEYPSTLLFGGKGDDTASAAGVAADTLNHIAGRQELTSANSVPFECVLMMAWPWVSCNKDRRPKPLPTHMFGNQQITMNITWKGDEEINACVSRNPNIIADPIKSKLILKTCDLHFEYFNFANKTQLAAVDSYVYPSPSIFSIEPKSGSIKYETDTAASPAINQKLSLQLNGLRQGETSHFIIVFEADYGENVIPINWELSMGGNQIFKSVDVAGKLSEAFQLPYDDITNHFHDKRFKFIADATKYQGGNNVTLPVSTSGGGAYTVSSLDTAGTVSGTALVAGKAIATIAAGALQTSINLEKFAIEGIPVCCWTVIPLGKNATSTNYHNYALGTRLDSTDVELQATFAPHLDIFSGTVKNTVVSSIRIIQVLNSFWQFTGDKIKLFK